MGKINVEVNSNMQSYTKDRNLAYICSVYSQNILSGQNYTNENKSIQINLSYGIKNDGKIYRVYKMQDDEQINFSNNLIVYEFNMDKIMEFWYSKDEELIKKYKFLIMLNLGQRDLDKLAKNDKKVGKYKMELESVNVSIGINDWISEEQDKEFIKNTLLIEGYKNGLKQGIEQGVEQGVEQGRKDAQREFVLNLFDAKMSIEEIAKISKISKEEVNEFINN